MTEKFKIEITTPGKLVFSGEVEMAVIPGAEGEFGVLAGHSPLISTVRSGVVNIFEKDQVTDKIFVAGGFAEVNPAECSVLATEAYNLSTIKREDIEKKIADAQTRLNTADTDFEKRRAQEAIDLNNQVLQALAA